MYRKPRFLEKLHAVREQLAEACGYDAERLAARLRSDTADESSAPSDEPTPPSLPAWAPSQSSQ